MSNRATFVISFAVGVGLAMLGLVMGLIGMAAALVAAVLTLVNYGRMPFAGIAAGIGATWTVVFALAAQNCAQPEQPCGATPVDLTPHIVISMTVLALGVAALILSLRRPKAVTTEG